MAVYRQPLRKIHRAEARHTSISITLLEEEQLASQSLLSPQHGSAAKETLT